MYSQFKSSYNKHVNTPSKQKTLIQYYLTFKIINITKLSLLKKSSSVYLDYANFFISICILKDQVGICFVKISK